MPKEPQSRVPQNTRRFKVAKERRFQLDGRDIGCTLAKTTRTTTSPSKPMTPELIHPFSYFLLQTLTFACGEGMEGPVKVAELPLW
jgi:hypothetical protein